MATDNKKIGMVFNPGAGKRASFTALARKLENKFMGYEIFCGSHAFGKEYIKGANEIFVSKNYDFSEAIERITGELIKNDVKLIICIGGDGINAHIASKMIEKNCDIPVMGIAGGTQNIGPLIRFDESSLAIFDAQSFQTEVVGCLKVTTESKVLGFAFCDVVIGDTYLGTYNNEICNLSAEAYIKYGIKQVKSPGKHVIRDDFVVKINDNTKKIKSKSIKQVIISPIYKPEFYIGKAMTGALCVAKYFEKGGCISLSDKVIIDMRITSLADSVTIEQLLFGNGDVCRISGFDGYIIIDGNVYECGSTIVIEYIENALQCVIDVCKNIVPVGR